MSPGGNTFFLVFTILSGLVSVPPVRLITFADTLLDRKLVENETVVDKKDATVENETIVDKKDATVENETIVDKQDATVEIELVLDRQPGDAVAGKLFKIQPCLRLLAAKGKSPNKQILHPVEVSSKFTDKCRVEGKTNSKWKIGVKNVYTDLKIDKPATGCVLVFTLSANGMSSRIESSTFDVFPTDLVLTISSVIAKNNQSNHFNLSFTFDLKNQILNFPWHYTVSFHQPLSHVSIRTYGASCSANFSQLPVDVIGCYLNNWGYRFRLSVKIESKTSSWSSSSISAPFDAFAHEFVPENAGIFQVTARLVGKVPQTLSEEEREQILANALNELGVKFPYLQWTNGFLDDIKEKNGYTLRWTAQGRFDLVRKICMEIGFKKIRWKKYEWIVKEPITISNQTECPELIEPAAKASPFPWKMAGLLILVGVLFLPICFLMCIWPRREREIQEKYQERLSRYQLTPEIKHREAKGEDNVAFQSDTNINTITAVNKSLPNGIANGSIKSKTDFVQLKAAHLAEHDVPDPLSSSESSIEGPQRIHLLRSRPPSKPTVVSPVAAQYATVDAPSPDDSIENLARDILGTPITTSDSQKGLTAPIVTSFVKFRSSTERIGSSISVSSIANVTAISTNGNDRHSAGTTLPEPQ